MHRSRREARLLQLCSPRWMRDIVREMTAGLNQVLCAPIPEIKEGGLAFPLPAIPRTSFSSEKLLPAYIRPRTAKIVPRLMAVFPSQRNNCSTFLERGQRPRSTVARAR
ncbi:hypothetical protein AAFF_G00351310 [Aldrovandia affinis]|uniref:Uncharacterized protein n=1 Tax=Aldrovandia affinis TaxID=143900 RepID=A0AAD7SIW0_9TELE|nr:hypothetical protein AAFF_G00351310 [Aldrovandia affinis]